MAAPLIFAEGIRRVAGLGARQLPKGVTSGPKRLQIDTKPFDKAVAMILKWWKPPPDMKQVIISELGAVLALTSNDTKMVGPKGKKSNTFKQAHRYVKRRYAPWKKYAGKGRKPKPSKGQLQIFQIGKKKYYIWNRYSDGVHAMINAAITRTRRKALLATGSSKAAWLRMYYLAAKQAGVSAKIPSTWKFPAEVKRTMKYMQGRSSKWSKATTASKQASPKNGDLVLKVFSKSHNTLNKGVKGGAAFQARINGREPFVKKAFTKKMKLTTKQQLKKFPGMAVPD